MFLPVFKFNVFFNTEVKKRYSKIYHMFFFFLFLAFCIVLQTNSIVVLLLSSTIDGMIFSEGSFKYRIDIITHIFRYCSCELNCLKLCFSFLPFTQDLIFLIDNHIGTLPLNKNETILKRFSKGNAEKR